MLRGIATLFILLALVQALIAPAKALVEPGIGHCPAPGQILVHGKCRCPSSQTLVDGKCVCPAGQTLVRGKCVRK
jgi:hypothetical protein